MKSIRLGLVLSGALAASACGGASEASHHETARSRSLDTAEAQADTGGRCDATQPGREVSSYDTSGDDRPDVRKVYRQAGVPPVLRLVLICRETDLNGDGTKDVVRFYSDEGRPVREEADRNFDGQMDEVTYFEQGHIARREVDTNGDARVDLKIFFEDGKPLRTERDMAGRSTASQWKPDRWEYFEDGRLVRVGMDVDGDGRVDRWDRDEEFHRAQQAREAAETASAAGNVADSGDTPGTDAQSGAAPTAAPPTTGSTTSSSGSGRGH